jgi:hypothetical protein
VQPNVDVAIVRQAVLRVRNAIQRTLHREEPSDGQSRRVVFVAGQRAHRTPQIAQVSQPKLQATNRARLYAGVPRSFIPIGCRPSRERVAVGVAGTDLVAVRTAQSINIASAQPPPEVAGDFPMQDLVQRPVREVA